MHTSADLLSSGAVKMYAPDTDSKLDDRSPSTTRRQMAPNYTYRLSSDDIRAIYGGSAAQAFADGNFMVAARLADANSELKGAALVLSGLLQEGLAILDKSDCLGAEGTLCRAFALWSLDRDAEAKVMLTGATDEKSRQFRALLERNGLTVFLTGAFLSIFPEQNTGSIMEPVHRYGPITAKYVGSQMAKNAYGYELGEPLDEFIAALPS